LTKKQVLQLQVRLKNGTQKHFEINGKFDASMEAAMNACLQDPDCFDGVVGRTL
jgi:hypothetical protein